MIALSTDIHKFSFNRHLTEYRGSAEVEGHLGWEKFRDNDNLYFNEHEGKLRVFTYNRAKLAVSLQDTPDVQSPITLTILEEDPDTKALQRIASLPNSQRPDPIGKITDQVYAAHFLDNHVYVEGNQTYDTIYGIDLTTSEDPQLSGNLSNHDHFDLLLPITDHLLLGIEEVALYTQLYLFDISDPSAPKESDVLTTGDHSTSLSGQHSIYPTDTYYRFSLPFTSSYFSYGNTQLYRCEIDPNTQSFVKTQTFPPLLASSNENFSGMANTVNWLNDQSNLNRSIITEQGVHYYHDGQFWSQDWQGQEAVTGPK